MKKLLGLLMIVVVVGFVGCGGDSPTGLSLVCKQFADEHWDPFSYLAWRASRISRNSSITHALPCSTYVIEGNLDNCRGTEVQQYYELLGKYDQFLTGWVDVQDANGNRVQSTQVDSVENYRSENRQAYEECRAGNLSALD